MSPMSRRSLLFGLAAGTTVWPLLASTGSAQAGPLPPDAAAALRLSRLAVDVAPLRALGLGVNADILGAALAAGLRRSFADRLVPGDRRAPVLLVRLSGVLLSTNFSGGGDNSSRRPHEGGGSSDYLEGVGLIVDGRGGVIASYPMLSALAAGSSGAAWYDPQLQQRRMVALAGNYAQWMRRTIIGR
jgi:hypothetical protein